MSVATSSDPYRGKARLIAPQMGASMRRVVLSSLCASVIFGIGATKALAAPEYGLLLLSYVLNGQGTAAPGHQLIGKFQKVEACTTAAESAAKFANLKNAEKYPLVFNTGPYIAYGFICIQTSD